MTLVDWNERLGGENQLRSVGQKIEQRQSKHSQRDQQTSKTRHQVQRRPDRRSEGVPDRVADHAERLRRETLENLTQFSVDLYKLLLEPGVKPRLPTFGQQVSVLVETFGFLVRNFQQVAIALLNLVAQIPLVVVTED